MDTFMFHTYEKFCINLIDVTRTRFSTDCNYCCSDLNKQTGECGFANYALTVFNKHFSMCSTN